jgi:hypothetical protein
MKIKTVCLVAIMTILWSLAPSSGAWAQGGWKWRSLKEHGGLGWGRRYDPQTVQTIAGKVTAVDHLTSGKGPGVGWRRLTLQTDQAAILVILGPAWYLEQQKVTFKPGDHLEALGSRIIFEERPYLIAAEVKKGKQTLKLRDQDGLPVWSSRARR